MPKTRNQKALPHIVAILMRAGLSEFEADQTARQVLVALFPERTLTAQQEMFGALCRTMVVDPALAKGRIAIYASKLVEAGYSAEQILAWYGDPEEGRAGSYWANDWRSRKNSRRPNEYDISATVKQYQTLSEGGNPDDKVLLQ